ncbi:MAG: biopolymer transporter ExbD [Candidatus Acidiferrales bacterium]
MGMATGEHKGATAEMNVVPLIDILLVLIIIFMIITPTISRGLDTLVPQTPSNPAVAPPPSAMVVVQILASGKVMINEDETTWEQLGPRLDAIFKLRAEKLAFVWGDDNVDFSDVARAIGIMRAHGVDKVGLMTARIASA